MVYANPAWLWDSWKGTEGGLHKSAYNKDIAGTTFENEPAWNPQIHKCTDIEIYKYPRLLTTKIQLRLPFQIVQICAQIHQDTRLFVSRDTRKQKYLSTNMRWEKCITKETEQQLCVDEKVGYFHISPHSLLSTSSSHFRGNFPNIPKLDQSRSGNSFHVAAAHISCIEF